MRHLTLLPAAILALLLALLCNRTEASLLYNFEEKGTGTVLAILELASLPATHTEVLGLTFTPAGQKIFGFGETYPGTFDTTGGDTPAQMIADGIGGLRSTSAGEGTGFVDHIDPPSSTTTPMYSFSRFVPRIRWVVMSLPSFTTLAYLMTRFAAVTGVPSPNLPPPHSPWLHFAW